jgi:lipopolysaccharide transport system permease protein
MSTLWRFRGLIWQSAISDLHQRYAGSGLGVFWNVITPLVMLALFTFVFSNLLAPRFAITGLAPGLFPLYLGSGFLPWAAFVDGVMRGTNALVVNGVYLKKMPIPEAVFPAQTALSSALGMGIAVFLLVALALAFQQPWHWTWLLLPVVILLWQSLGFGLSLVFGTLNVFFRDVGQVLGVVLQIWMWSIPVVYVADLLPSEFQLLLPFNPAYPYLTALRDLYLYAELPAGWIWGAMIGWSLLSIVLGYGVLNRLRSEIRDVL